MLVTEIFNSIDGEGKYAGKLATFIRFAGCNLRCSYCDTLYAQEHDSGTEMSIEELIGLCKYDHVTITGGEPLLQTDLKKLIVALLKINKFVNIETNGSIDIRGTKLNDFFLNYTIDYKSKSSGMNNSMLMSNFEFLSGKDVIKFVVGNREDLLDMKRVIETFPTKAQIYVSPVFGQIEPVEIVEFMKEFNLEWCKLQLQLHKLIWPVNMRAV